MSDADYCNLVSTVLAGRDGWPSPSRVEERI